MEGVMRGARLILLLTALVPELGAAAAQSLPIAPPGGGGGDPPPSCIENVTASFNASPSTVALGQPTTLSWNVHAGACGVTQSIGGLGNVARSGSLAVTPTTPRSYTLTVWLGNSRSKSFSTSVGITLPKDQYGRINVTITSNEQNALFVQAIGSEESTNAIVHIQNNVTLDLSHRADIDIAPGVQILGGRDAHNPGPLLFTTTYPERLFVIDRPWIIDRFKDADNVRISGIRLRGADGAVSPDGGPRSTGIAIDSCLNVEIDNNEIFGWHISAIRVHDTRERIDRRNGKGAIRIHDNDLHHNQQIGEGYGAEISDGAYALVEKNSFDYNRHAIAADGSYGNGYFFYRNYIGKEGGHHEALGIPYRTHQIDMHGQEDCWGAQGYCGVAGEYMDVRYNAVLYNAGTALRVRGTPTVRADVAYNYFWHETVWGNWEIWHGAMEQTDGTGAITQWGNTFRADYDAIQDFAINPCDFDGDGHSDEFLATGSAWFVFGPVLRPRYLNTSTLRAGDLEFGDLDGDGICDVRVRADGRVSWGGRTPLTALARTDFLSRNAVSGQLRISRFDGAAITGNSQYSVATDRDVVGTGDFDGDGDSDILVRWRDLFPFPGGDGSGRPTRVLFLQDGAVASEAAWGFSPLGGGVQGIGDFDGDGTSDVLWRDETGRLKLWYWGVSANVDVSWHNEGGVVTADWRVTGVGDFNGDGYADIVWQHDNGLVLIWLMVGSIHTGEFSPGPNAGPAWKIAGVGDFDADGRADLLWRHDTGGLAISFKGSDVGAAHPTWRNQGTPTDLSLQVKGVSDFNHDGRADILWQRADGASSVWMMEGGSYAGESAFVLDNAWPLQGLLPIR
jgi:hypothetical protein